MWGRKRPIAGERPVEQQDWPDAHAYLSQNVSPQAASFFTDLFFPQLVMVRGCMLRSLAYNPEFFEQWWVHFDGDTEGVESMINHLHLWEVFALEDGKEYPELDSVALRVAQTWKLNAEQLFPTALSQPG